ncbi:MAG: hypothetical protein ACXABU_16045 [Candidatus Hodarchaeales archaeon]|jgi:predicted transcriptional regulator
MNSLLKRESTLKLLLLLCSGEGVDFNVSALANKLNKHRNTIKDRIDHLLESKIIEKPVYPLEWLFSEYPLLVISKDKFYRDENTRAFIENDPHIFAAYVFQEEVYNTVTLQFHKDLYSYQIWSDKVLDNGKIIREEDRHPPDALFLSTRRILKYDTFAPFRNIERGYKQGIVKSIGDFEIDSLSISILRLILNGNCIRTNENFLARALDVNRNTITRQIQSLMEQGILGKPTSRFPLTLVPPGCMLIFSLFEIKKRCLEVANFLRRDPRIPLLVKANLGRYNYFVTSTFRTVEDHIKWQEKYTQNFHACIEAIKNTYLSPALSYSINQNFVSLELIKRKLTLLQEEEQH